MEVEQQEFLLLLHLIPVTGEQLAAPGRHIHDVKEPGGSRSVLKLLDHLFADLGFACQHLAVGRVVNLVMIARRTMSASTSGGIASAWHVLPKAS